MNGGGGLGELRAGAMKLQRQNNTMYDGQHRIFT